MRVWSVLMIAAVAACGSGEETDDGTVDDTEPAVDDTDEDTTPPADDTDTVVTDDTDVDDTTDTTPDLPDDPCFEQTPIVRVGTGEFNFEALRAGEDLEMVFGPQGGWHFWVSVAAENVTATVIAEVMITDAETGIALHASTVNIGLKPLVAGAWACDGTYAGILGVLGTTNLIADSTPPQALCGREVDLSVTLRAPTVERQLLGTASARMIAQPDPANGTHCDSPTPLP
jgi:hypothetical protein